MPKLAKSLELIVRRKRRTINYPLVTNYSLGYTFIELLVVIGIIAILSVIAFINIKDFSSSQALVKAAGEIQSMLRLAQSNASSSTVCGNQGNQAGVSWTARFNNDNSINIYCGTDSSCTEISCYKTISLEQKVQISAIKTSACTNLSLPLTITYSALKGVPLVADNAGHISTNKSDPCFGANSDTTIVLINSKGDTKNIVVTGGGGINVQ